MERRTISLKEAARRFAQLFALWTTVAVLFSVQWYTYDALHAHPSPVINYLRWNIEQWYTWLLISPLVLWLAARRPIDLFNTLHAIGTLIHEDPTSAEQMLLNLSSLLRVFLEQESSKQISLRRELHLIDLYLSIQRIRFRDRLTVRSLIDPETLDGSIPSLILQPLVENAIVHGIARNLGSDEIEIRSSKQQDRLVITISNSNSPLSGDVHSDGTGWGVGLSNTMQRLAQTYNGSAKLSIHARSPLGVVCEISMPFTKTASMPSAEEELLAL
jgi:two-component system, LytTR family, sensor kinase